MFAAWPLIAKIGAPLGVFALLGTLYYFHNENIRDKERAVIEAQNAITIQKNNELTLEHERQQHAGTVEVLQANIKERKRLQKLSDELAFKNTKLQAYVDAKQSAVPDREVTYVQINAPDSEQVCTVPADVTELVDNLARVFNAIPYSRAVSEDGTDPGDFVVPGPGPATCSQLKRRIQVLNGKLTSALIDHRSLTEKVQQDRAIEATFHVHQRELAE